MNQATDQRRPAVRKGILPALLLALAPVLAAPGSAQEEAAPALFAPGEIAFHAEVLSPGGEPLPAAERPALEVIDRQERLPLADRGAVGDRWRLVVYFDLELLDGESFRRSAAVLEERARALTAAGEVELVLAEEDSLTELPATRDPFALSEELSWLRVRKDSRQAQAELRGALLEALGGDEADEEGVEGAAGPLPPEAAGELLQAALDEESALLEDRLARLLTWVLDHPSQGPKALLLVTSGFDDELRDFYLPLERRGPLSFPERLLEAETLARVLAGEGWTVAPYLPAARGAGLPEGAADEDSPVEERLETVEQGGREAERSVIGFDPRKLFRREEQEEEPVVLETPVASLERLAAAAGGELVSETRELDGLLARLPARRLLAYEPSSSALLEGLRPVEVTAGAEEDDRHQPRIRARGWVADSMPEAVSALRARNLLLAEPEEGALEIAAVVRPAVEGGGESELAVSIESEPALVLGRAPLRVTVATATLAGRVEVRHFTGLGATREGLLVAAYELPEELESPVAVVVTDLEGGRWGATFASLLEAAAGAGERPAADLLPSARQVRLLLPVSGMAYGPTPFTVAVARGQVERVEYFLDGQAVASRAEPPYQALLDLGPLPRTRRVQVVAYGADGREVGRDELLVNDGGSTFRVWIREPTLEELRGRRPLIGPVDIQVEVRLSQGLELERMEFFWKEILVATRFAPPWRQRVVIPPDDSRGFVRVVAHLDDGTTTEDVLFLNSPGSIERLNVELVELFTVVTDRQGRLVRDMTEDRFKIMEEGEEQEIASFNLAGELPLTVGLALDASASMFVKLPEVQAAASEFLQGLKDRRDRAFVVGFGDHAEVEQSTTADLSRAIEAVARLQPAGRTAIWEAIVYGLVQLQGVPGKKALIVYSDGADEDPDFSYRTALRFARMVGVPVYVIVTNNEILRTEGEGLSIRGFLSRLEELTSSVGGRVFMSRVGEDLRAVYREIDEELRSQYLIGYYTQDRGGEEWRELDVEVSGPGVRARTIAGFYR